MALIGYVTPHSETGADRFDRTPRLLARLRAGNAAAQRELWERYFRRLVALARTKLGNTPRAAADEEDVAIVAIEALLEGLARDRFPDLGRSGSVWALLAKIAAREAVNERRRQHALKRGGGRVVSPLRWDEDEPQSHAAPPAPIRSNEPIDQHEPPEAVALVHEAFERLMAACSDPMLRDVAQRRIDGWTNAEIAEDLGVAERTIERRVRRVRACWNRVGGTPQGGRPEASAGR
ncbi:MAG: sigma-70 family RNA polymerase sigma factor [Lacipirellulaceae bacterium]